MADRVVYTQGSGEGTGGMGFLLGMILLIAFLALIFFYGVPYVMNQSAGPSINVPESVNINTNPGSGGN